MILGIDILLLPPENLYFFCQTQGQRKRLSYACPLRKKLQNWAIVSVTLTQQGLDSFSM